MFHEKKKIFTLVFSFFKMLSLAFFLGRNVELRAEDGKGGGNEQEQLAHLVHLAHQGAGWSGP